MSRMPLGRMGKKATIADVASMAGVSIKTVSRVANKEANVRLKTRIRVQHVIDGRLACTFYYPTCSAEGLGYAVKLARGEQVPEQHILEPAQISIDNAKEWYEKVTVE